MPIGDRASMPNVDTSASAAPYGSATPAWLRLLGGGVRLSDRYGVRDASESALRPLPNARSPLGVRDHSGLRDLRGRHDHHAAWGALHRRARRAPRRDARWRGDDDGGSRGARRVEGSARTADRARAHRGGDRAGCGRGNPVPHRVACPHVSERIRGLCQEHRHRSERRRTWNRPIGCRHSCAVGAATADLALPPLRRARRGRADWCGGRTRDRRANSAAATGKRRLVHGVRSGFPFRQQPRPLRPLPPRGCSPGCPDSSWPPRCTVPHMRCPAQHCSWFFRREWCPSRQRTGCVLRASWR